MAAMLLTSMCAFAQSENTEPLKGDVNGDGKIDVADITAIVKIIMENGGGTAHNYTWYLGETEQESFTTADFNMTGTKPTVLNIGPSSGDKVTVWIYPQSWGKPTKILDPNGNDMTNAFIYGDDWMTIPNGYYGGWTQLTLNTTWRVTWPETYYWYVGTENPMNMSSISPIVNDNNSPGWRLIGNTLPIYSSSNKLLDITTNGSISLGGRVKYYIAVPSPNIKIYSANGYDVTNASFNTLDPVTINNVTYTIYEYKNTAVNLGYDLY